MSCPVPKKPVDVLVYTVHPRGPLDDVRKRVGSPVSQAELARCLTEHVLPVLGCRSCLDGICAASVEVQQKNAQLQADAERLGDALDAEARAHELTREALAEATRKLEQVERQQESWKDSYQAAHDLHQHWAERAERAEADNAVLLARLREVGHSIRSFTHAEACSVEDEYDLDEVEGCVCVIRLLPEIESGSSPGAALLAAVRQVLAVVDRPTTPALQDAQLRELGVALEGLRAALESSEGEVRHG